MKKYNFVFVEKNRKVSRTYGGSDYTLSVYEVVKDELIHLGDVKACTRGHMGEEHEAWRVVRKERPNVIKLLARRIKKSGDKHISDPAKTNYYTWNYRNYGVQIKQA